MSSLFNGLIDDAAVFPPGSSPLDAAVLTHRVWRTGPVSPYLGPLLVRVDQVADLAGLLDTFPVDVAVIGTPGGAYDLVVAAEALAEHPGASVVGAELPLPSDDVDAWPTITAVTPLISAGMQVAVEIGRRHPADVLRSMAGLAEVTSGQVLAKIRTGGPTPESWPSFADLAGWIRQAVRLGIAFKCTAGLHHAIADADGPEIPHHGVLNVMAATDAAHEGAGTSELAQLLADPGVADLLSSLPDHRIIRLRASFRSFGCCGATEPLAEFAELGLIPPLTEDIPA